ncbi:hypothetical protein Tco_0138444 [Tanacetum coccineum]
MRETKSLNYGMTIDPYPYLTLYLKDRTNLNHKWLRCLLKPYSDPRDVKIASLKQRIQELEFPQLQQDLPAEEAKTESNVWDDGSEDVNPFGGGNPSFQEEPIVLVEEESCPVYNTDNEEEESMQVYDTDIEDVIEEEEG